VLLYLDGGLIVRSRNGHNITTAVPELTPMSEQLAGRSVVLDGELVARQGRRGTSATCAVQEASVLYALGRMPMAEQHKLAIDGGHSRGRQTYCVRRIPLHNGRHCVTDTAGAPKEPWRWPCNSRCTTKPSPD
jgi:hypothetical protein